MLIIALTGFTACLIAVMVFARQSDAGRLLHRQLVERPLAALGKFRRHHLLYAVILPVLLLSGGEVALLLGPEFFAAYALELAVYLDAVIMTYALSAMSGMKGAAVRVGAIMARLPRARRKREKLALKSTRKPANDDDPAPLRLAA